MMQNPTYLKLNPQSGKVCKHCFVLTSRENNATEVFLFWSRHLNRHGINNLLESHDEVRKIYKESVGQIVQMARLVPKEASFHDSFRKPDNIILANTHLFYHPMADHIRLLQVYAICHKLDEVRREHHNTSPVLICGDFNSGPLSGEFRLVFEYNNCLRAISIQSSLSSPVLFPSIR